MLKYVHMKKKSKIITTIIICITILAVILTLTLVNKESSNFFGVWWWDDELNSETYLDFAKNNNITEIYYCSSKFDETTASFIGKANSRKIDVYWLAGEYQWLNDSTNLCSQIYNYIKYQEDNSNYKFAGIHLDIEPHQNPDFKNNRYELIYKLIDLASNLKTTYPSIKFDYDIPFWLHDEITYNNQTKPAYEFMIDIANRVFVMSYRDTLEDILNISKEEISYAKQHSKQLFLCVETYSTEGDNVSYMEEGNQKMLEDINNLKNQIPDNFGIAIHHIKRWKELT